MPTRATECTAEQLRCAITYEITHNNDTGKKKNRRESYRNSKTDFPV